MFFGRGKNKIQNPYTLPDMYKEYIKDKEGPYALSYKEFVDISNSFYKGIADYILGGGIYKMPYRLGEISVVKFKPTLGYQGASTINWVKTNETGKAVIETNDHSNYNKFRFYWSRKNNSKVKNVKRYGLQFTRALKRRLAAIIKSGEYNFFELKHSY